MNRRNSPSSEKNGVVHEPKIANLFDKGISYGKVLSEKLNRPCKIFQMKDRDQSIASEYICIIPEIKLSEDQSSVNKNYSPTSKFALLNKQIPSASPEASRFSLSQDSLPYASLSMNKTFSQEHKESIVSVKNIKPVSEFSVAHTHSPTNRKHVSFDEQATIEFPEATSKKLSDQGRVSYLSLNMSNQFSENKEGSIVIRKSSQRSKSKEHVASHQRKSTTSIKSNVSRKPVDWKKTENVQMYS